MKEFIEGYLLFINLIAVIVCVADKRKAKKRSRRIKERTLWIISAAGGSIGMYITMHFIRHKTLHRSFMRGLPLLIIVQIIVILVLTKLFGGHIIS